MLLSGSVLSAVRVLSGSVLSAVRVLSGLVLSAVRVLSGLVLSAVRVLSAAAQVRAGSKLDSLTEWLLPELDVPLAQRRLRHSHRLQL